MLAITTDGRKAALDFRLVAPLARFDENGKVAACVREVHAIWQRTAEFRGAQLVFCDLSSPRAARASASTTTCGAADRCGHPRKEIAFVHDAETDVQKATLFKAVREGRSGCCWAPPPRWAWAPTCRTPGGPAPSMRHGVPATSSSGRAHPAPGQRVRGSGDLPLRHGAKLRRVLWQTLETKARFIAQVMSGDKGIRSIEDVELATLSYAEVKALASGNPLVIEKAGVDAEVARLSTLFSVWRNQRYANESEVGRLPMMIESLEKKLALHAADAADRAQTMAQIAVELGGRKIAGPMRWATRCASW
jgi:hypothetical protein